MKKWTGIAAAAVMAIGLLGALLMFAPNDGEPVSDANDDSPVAAVCAPDHPNCQDTVVVGDNVDTPNDEPLIPSDSGDSAVAAVCAPDHPNCQDTVAVGQDGVPERELDADESEHNLEVPRLDAETGPAF